MKKSIFYRFSPFMALLAALFLFAGMAKAELEKGKYSEAEKIGYAFHQLSGSEPDFVRWIEDKEKYKDLKATDKAELKKNELLRLQNGYYNYYPDTDVISLNIPSDVEILFSKKGNHESETRAYIDIKFSDMPEDSYLPFQIGDLWVAIVIKDADKLLNFSLTLEEYKEIEERLKMKAAANNFVRKAGVDLKLKPISVDTDSPIHLNGIDMWLMLAEVGEMTVWRERGGEKKPFFTYTAPWYISGSRQQLLDLYRDDN